MSKTADAITSMRSILLHHSTSFLPSIQESTSALAFWSRIPAGTSTWPRAGFHGDNAVAQLKRPQAISEPRAWCASTNRRTSSELRNTKKHCGETNS